MVEKTKKSKLAAKSASKPILHPEFGRILDEWMIRTRSTNHEVGIHIGDKNGEKIRRYRKGESMPRSRSKMQMLADLIGITPAELRGEGSPQILQSMLGTDEKARDEDEYRLLKAYRKLKPVGQKAIRAHAAKLLEQQGVPGKDNPFGRGGTN